MKSKKSTVFASLLVLSLVVGMSLEPATSAATGESPYTITEFIVATGSAVQSSPDISGNIVVWSERPDGLVSGDNRDIYALDLGTGQQFVVCRADRGQTQPRISGKLVVWQDDRSGRAVAAEPMVWQSPLSATDDIYAYDLEQRREFAVATGEALQRYPDVSGNIIVWEDRRNGNSDIYAYDVSTGNEFPITTDPAEQFNSRISGNLVVWQDLRLDDDGDIYAYDLEQKREFAVAAGEALQWRPDVSGHRIVWLERRYGSVERSIHVLDTESGVETIIVRGAWVMLDPVISGDLVVWSDSREKRGSDIYGYDLEKGVEFPVSRAIGNQSSPAIDGMRVVWTDDRNDGVSTYEYDLDIYGAVLEDKPGPIVPVIGALAEVDAKIEIVWPKGVGAASAAVTEADRANISIYLFHPGTLDVAPCQWWPPLRLWAALNSETARPVTVATPGVRYTDLGAVRTWEFDNVDVSAARDPLSKIYFFVTLDGVITHTNVWAHGADARTYYPQQEIPGGIGVVGDKLDAKIQIVWPHDGQGNPRSVSEASLVNIGVDVFVGGSLLSVPPDWNGTVRLYRSLNNGVEELAGIGQKRLVAVDNVTYPRWDFNNVDVSAATDPLNNYYFRIAVDGVETTSNVWSHGAEGRTYFPNIDVPTSGCAQTNVE